MKHTLKITLLLVGIFMAAQIVGLLVTNQYIDHQTSIATGNITFTQLPYNIERPPVEQSSSFVYIIIAVLLATIIMFLLIKFRTPWLWKVWFFLAVILCLTISIGAFVNKYVALAIAVILAVFKIFRPNIYIHNLSEVLIYGGLAAIFVPIMNVFASVMLLILISIYDVIAVWKSGHMIKLAKFQTESKVFAGLLIRYKAEKTGMPKIGKKIEQKQAAEEPRNAVLGGGDIGFPLLFAGVVMKGFMLQNGFGIAFLKALIIPLFAAIALLLLLLKAKKDRFYPAMPFISAGCFVGYAIVMLI
ncbi:MAG: presenilin family intramembrane aspartyl protease [Candidatus Woesearchaeota archaeon]